MSAMRRDLLCGFAAVGLGLILAASLGLCDQLGYVVEETRLGAA